MNKKILFLSIILIFIIKQTYSVEYKSTYILYYSVKASLKNLEDVKTELDKNIEIKKQISFTNQIVSSDTIKNLKKKKYYAIIGFCDDSVKANLTIQIAKNCNVEIKKKLVQVNKNFNYFSPILTPTEQPFEGEEYIFLPFQNVILNDSCSNNTIDIRKFRFENFKVIVNTETCCFEKEMGVFTVKFYLAWVKDLNKVGYIPEFQFTTIPDYRDMDAINIENNLDTVTLFIEIYGTFTRGYKLVQYEKGISYRVDMDIESCSASVEYSTEIYNYKQVLFYYIGNGYFRYLIDGTVKNFGKYDDGDYECVHFYETSVGDGCSGDWCGLKLDLKNKKIVFYEGSGA